MGEVAASSRRSVAGQRVGVAASTRRRRRRDAERRAAPRSSVDAGRCVSERADADVVGVDEPQVEPAAAGRGDDLGGPARARATVTVSKNALVLDLDAAVAQRRRPAPRRSGGCGVAIARRPVGAVVDGVHDGHDGEQHLRGADVGGRLLAADVLLAGLQREPVGRAALGVDRDADQPAGQVPLEARRATAM